MKTCANMFQRFLVTRSLIASLFSVASLMHHSTDHTSILITMLFKIECVCLSITFNNHILICFCWGFFTQILLQKTEMQNVLNFTVNIVDLSKSTIELL